MFVVTSRVMKNPLRLSKVKNLDITLAIAIVAVVAAAVVKESGQDDATFCR